MPKEKEVKKKVSAKPMTSKGDYSSKTSEPKNEDAKERAAVKKVGKAIISKKKK